jgi:hypothetical protein
MSIANPLWGRIQIDAAPSYAKPTGVSGHAQMAEALRRFSGLPTERNKLTRAFDQVGLPRRTKSLRLQSSRIT